MSTDEGGRGKKAPVGAQRFWESTGEIWVKTHENGSMDSLVSTWIVRPHIPEIFLKKFTELDNLGKEIYSFKEPIEGELWLDYEFKDFRTRSGKKFDASEFKRFAAFGGFKGYNFGTELTARYINDSIEFNSFLAELMNEANESAKLKLAQEGKEINDSKAIFLTKEEVKEIKKVAKERFKYDETTRLTFEDVQDIEGILSRVVTYLRSGENFEGKQKEVYNKAKLLLDEINKGPFQSITTLKQKMSETIVDMNEHFSDAWGVRVSYLKKLDTAFTGYIQKYRKDVEEETLQTFLEQTKVDLYCGTDEFYEAIEDKVYDILKNSLNPEDYIGQIVPHPVVPLKDALLLSIDYTRSGGKNDDYMYITYKDSITGKEEKSMINKNRYWSRVACAKNNYDISIPLKLRFDKLYDKGLYGGFDINSSDLCKVFEKLCNSLPAGHLLTNNNITNLRRESMFSKSDNSYAHYNSRDKEIYFSDEALKASSSSISIDSGESEIVGVLAHEVGHAVSQKLGRRKDKNYKHFVYECGWSWEQFERNDPNSYTATGNDKDIMRHGTNSDRPLLTEYATKSPEEAFAEFYSFYTQNKRRIDEYLVSNKSNALKAHVGYKTIEGDKNFTYQPLGSDVYEKRNQDIFFKLTVTKNRKIKDHIRTGVLDPFNNDLETMTEGRTLTGHIVSKKHRMDPNYKEPQPVFTVFDYHTGKHDIIPEGQDHHIHYANKYLRRLSPTFSISKEVYTSLKEEGYTYDEIREFTLSRVKDTPIPEVRIGKGIFKGSTEKISGLKYRGEIIETPKIEKMVPILKRMKTIWESDELKKAIEELFTLEPEDEDVLNKAVNQIENTMGQITESKLLELNSIFEQAKNTIKRALEGKESTPTQKHQKYADVVVQNTKGEILLLCRNTSDDFMPGKWALPGGKVEEGEDFITAASRELQEETGLCFKPQQLTYLETRRKTDCTIGYFYILVSGNDPMILDNEEHYHYQWVKKTDLIDYGMIFDLQDVLLEFELPPIPIQLLSFETTTYNNYVAQLTKSLEDGFNKGEIDTQTYLQTLSEVEQKKREYTNYHNQQKFEKGEISTKDFFKTLSL